MIQRFFRKAGPFSPRSYGQLQRISRRVYLFRNITNSSFVIGDRGVAVVDTQVNFPSAERVLAAVRSVTDKPIRYVVNTHYHWDHTNGNRLFKEQGAEIHASALTKRFMVERAERQKAFLSGRGFELGEDPQLPDVTFEGEKRLDLGGVTLRLFFAGAAETEDATAIEVPEERVVMSGDTVMTGSFPIFGQPVWDEGLEGDDRWIRTIQVLAAVRPKHILPGHGPLAHAGELALLIKIQRFFLEEVSALVQKGYRIDRVLADLEPRLPGWIRKIPVVWGTPRYAILRVYRGLTKKNSDTEPGWQSFKPSVIPAADPTLLAARTARCQLLQDFLSAAAEAGEGGDAGLKLALLKEVCVRFASEPRAYAAYADALVECSKREDSVLEKGDFFQEARAAWRKALEIDPACPEALLGMGRYWVMMAYRGGDDPSAGMKLLEELLRICTRGRVAAEAQFYIGMGYRRLGDEAEAGKRFRHSLENDPSFMPARLAGKGR